MKTFLSIFSCLLVGSLTANAHAILVNPQVKIEGPQAKYIYNALRGSEVQNEGAAGHLFRQGKSILCRYTNADMDDRHGKAVPRTDPRRFACTIQFDENGLASPGKF